MLDPNEIPDIGQILHDAIKSKHDQYLMMKEQMDLLRKKNRNQRTELRRLNKTLKAIWEGVRFQQHCTAEMGRKYREERAAANQVPVLDGPRDLDFVDRVEKEAAAR